MFNIKDVINGQEVAQAKRYEDTRFIGDYEPMDSFTSTDYDNFTLVDTDSTQDKLVEKVVATNNTDMYLITATTTMFAGEKQVNFISQQLSLKGYNFFMKDQDNTEFYNNYLQANGYDITVGDISNFGIFKPEFAESTILQFTDKDDNYHTLTVNKFKQLSKISVKLSARKVNSHNSIQSAFA